MKLITRSELASLGISELNALYRETFCAFRPWRTLVPVMADSVGA